MMLKLHANAATFSDDGECTLMGFADDPNQPVAYIMLQLSNDPDEEERDFGWHGVHIEIGSLGVDGYDLVEDIRQTATGVGIRLAPDAAQRAGIAPEIEIELESERIGDVSVGEAVRRFKDRLVSSGRTRAAPPRHS